MTVRDRIIDLFAVLVVWIAGIVAAGGVLLLGASIYEWLRFGEWSHPSVLWVVSGFTDIGWIGIRRILDVVPAWLFFAALGGMLWAVARRLGASMEDDIMWR